MIGAKASNLLRVYDWNLKVKQFRGYILVVLLS